MVVYYEPTYDQGSPLFATHIQVDIIGGKGNQRATHLCLDTRQL